MVNFCLMSENSQSQLYLTFKLINISDENLIQFQCKEWKFPVNTPKKSLIVLNSSEKSNQNVLFSKKESESELLEQQFGFVSTLTNILDSWNLFLNKSNLN